MPDLTFPNQDRAILVAARLGDEQVTVTRLEGVEELSRPFRFQLEFLSSDSDLKAKELLRQPLVVGVRTRVSSGTPPRDRYFHGLVHRFSYRGEVASPGQAHAQVSRYQAEMVPWLWFLKHRTNCRIFQAKTVPQIVEAVLREHSLAFDSNGIRGQYLARDYCVQYRESDFDFVSRLLEEEGIYYYFRQSTERHELVLADQLSAYYECAEPEVRFDELGTAATPNHIVEWEHNYEYRSGTFMHQDFNYHAPQVDMFAMVPSTLKLPSADAGGQTAAQYDYPGGYGTVEEGRRYARIRMEEEEAAYDTIRGTGVCTAFSPGATFRLVDHPRSTETANPMVIVRVEHQASPSVKATGTTDEISYQNRFRCLPAGVIFRPSRLTPRPVMQGAQTAIVTGPADELVYTDALGRVKVQFHWDRLGQRNEDSSCWIRVSQDWAGPSYGSVLLPHVGHEVIVSFLEADPDRPVITGRLYNAVNTPPDELPEHKHRAIVAQDEVGNVIALDADEKRVDIQNAEDKFELTAGEEVSATAGMSVGITLGCDVGINLGASLSAALAASFDVSVGMSSSVFIGGAYDASIGGSFSYAKGNFVNAGDSVGQIAFQQGAEFVSHESVMLAGGSKAKNSVVLASSDELILSYGKTDPKFAGNPKLALGLGVFGAAVIGTLGIAALGASAFLGAKAKDEDDFKDYMGGAIGSGLLGLGAAAVAGVLLAKYAAVWSQVKQPVHGTPSLPCDARLRLTNEKAELWGEEAINMLTRKLNLNGLEEVSIVSPKTTITGPLDVTGKFTSANILDIGQPAAEAAAKAKAQAKKAMEAARQAAESARSAAKQASAIAKASVLSV